VSSKVFCKHTLYTYTYTYTYASFLSAGVTLFQARAGNFQNAIKFTGPLRATVDELIQVQNEFGPLTETGVATLRAMDDVLTAMRLGYV